MTAIPEKIKKISAQRNLVPKAASLILALLLWAYIAGTRAGELKFRVPVKVRTIPAYLAVSYMSDKYVTVLLEGKKENLRNINTKAIQAYVDVQAPRLGETKKYKINFSAYELPENISVKLVNEYVSMIVERKFDKAVRVVPMFAGSFKSGYTSGRVVLNPEYVIINGPRSYVDSINVVFTEEISINDEAEDFSRDIEINRDIYPEIAFSQSGVKLNVSVLRSADLSHADVPISFLNIDGSVRYNAPVHSVRVYFDSALSGKIDTAGLSAYADAGGINIKKIMSTLNRTEMDIDLPVRLNFTKNIAEKDVVKILPEVVRVKIKVN